MLLFLAVHEGYDMHDNSGVWFYLRSCSWVFGDEIQMEMDLPFANCNPCLADRIKKRSASIVGAKCLVSRGCLERQALCAFMPRASEQARGVTSEPPPPRRSLKVNSEVQYLTVLLQKIRKKDHLCRAWFSRHRLRRRAQELKGLWNYAAVLKNDHQR